MRTQMLETVFVLGCACVGLISGSPAGNPLRESVNNTVVLVANRPCQAMQTTAVALNRSLARLRLRIPARLFQ